MIRFLYGIAFLALANCQPAFAQTASTAFEGSVRVLPDISLSPSALAPVNPKTGVSDVVRPNLKYSDLCPHANTTALRNIPPAQAKAIYVLYGMTPLKGACAAPDPVTHKNPGGCEVDHICSLELGCTNDIKNTWVQPYAGVCWTAHVKDAYEDWLHTHFVCGTKADGDISDKQVHFAANLAQAQQEIAGNWIAGYKSHPELPLPACAH